MACENCEAKDRRINELTDDLDSLRQYVRHLKQIGWERDEAFATNFVRDKNGTEPPPGTGWGRVYEQCDPPEMALNREGRYQRRPAPVAADPDARVLAAGGDTERDGE